MITSLFLYLTSRIKLNTKYFMILQLPKSPFRTTSLFFCKIVADAGRAEPWYTYKKSSFDSKLLDYDYNQYYYNKLMELILPLPKFSDATSLQYYITAQTQNALAIVCPKVHAPIRPWIYPELLYNIRVKNYHHTEFIKLVSAQRRTVLLYFFQFWRAAFLSRVSSSFSSFSTAPNSAVLFNPPSPLFHKLPTGIL